LADQSSAHDERTRRGDDFRAYLVEIAFAQQSGRGPVVQLRVQSHEPRLGDLAAVTFADQLGDAQRQSEAGLDTRLARAPAVLRVLLHRARFSDPREDRKSTRLNSSHQIISYAVFCLKK